MEHGLHQMAGIAPANENNPINLKDYPELQKAIEQKLIGSVANHLTELMKDTVTEHEDCSPMQIYKQGCRSMLIYGMCMLKELSDADAQQVMEELSLMVDNVIADRKKS